MIRTLKLWWVVLWETITNPFTTSYIDMETLRAYAANEEPWEEGDEPVIEKMIELFDEYSEYLGLDDARSPDMQPQNKQCEFEEKFNELVCQHRGHDIGPDQCGKPEHDFCYRCQKFASSLQGCPPPEAPRESTKENEGG